MEVMTLLRSGLKKHRGSLLGVFFLTFLVSVSLAAVLTVWYNSSRFLDGELTRYGYGNLTAWVSQVEDLDGLVDSLNRLSEVETVTTQRIIFSDYRIGQAESDSEGQLIQSQPEDGRYRFFTDDLSGYREDAQIAPGEVYVSPSLISMFGVQIGDTVTFPIARNGGDFSFTIAGFYEDPAMGSSMIGMKGFLICPSDYNVIVTAIDSAGIDALGRVGAMLHVFGSVPTPDLNTALNTGTPLPLYTEFVHSREAITGFMLVLQNAFSGFLLAFTLVLLGVVLTVLGHSIRSSIEADYQNMGILKTLGMTSHSLRRVQLFLYAVAVLPAMVLGLGLAIPAAAGIADATITTTGILLPSTLPWLLCLAAFTLFGAILAGTVTWKTGKIREVRPLAAIRGETQGVAKTGKLPPLNGKHLSLSLALRQVVTHWRHYAGVCVAALLLTFFASLVGRMDSWLGPDGKGMMDAFNPADHDIGVQMFGVNTDEDARNIILEITDITDAYALAMPDVAVNGVNVTANVITEPERFHLLAGQPCYGENEIVMTEFLASHLGLSIGDSVTIQGNRDSREYVISGIYVCANDMGRNLGMNREGFLAISQDNPKLWCQHYFLADPGQKAAVTSALEGAFHGDVHVHENTWPGLQGIIAAMNGLLVFMYAMVLLFVLTVTAMTSRKLQAKEQRDTGIYKAIGFSGNRLRCSFSLRFLLTSALGAVLGVGLGAVFTDPLVGAVMKLEGISNFSSHPGAWAVCLPALMVTGLFTLCSWLLAGKGNRTDLTILISE